MNFSGLPVVHSYPQGAQSYPSSMDPSQTGSHFTPLGVRARESLGSISLTKFANFVVINPFYFHTPTNVG